MLTDAGIVLPKETPGQSFHMPSTCHWLFREVLWSPFGPPWGPLILLCLSSIWIRNVAVFYLPESGCASSHDFALTNELGIKLAAVECKEDVKIDACEGSLAWTRPSHGTVAEIETYGRKCLAVYPCAQNPSPDFCETDQTWGSQLPWCLRYNC